MSRTSGSIELVGYPGTSTPLTITQPASIHPKGDDTPPVTGDQKPFIAPVQTFSAEQRDVPGKGTTAIVLVTVVCVTMISSMLSGVTTVTLPTMARELNLAPSVLLWYCIVPLHP